MVCETALAFMLAAGAGLMIRTLSGLLEVPTGLISPERVLVADLDLPRARYPEDRVTGLAQQFLQRASMLPGVRNVALTSSVPLDPRGRAEFGFILEGGDETPPGQNPKAEIVWATPGYLQAVGIPLLRGRDVGWTDVNSSLHVVLVNEAFVRRYLPQGEPLGPGADRSARRAGGPAAPQGARARRAGPSSRGAGGGGLLGDPP